MATAPPSASPRLLSSQAPKADDTARADTDLASLEEGRRSVSLDEPLQISALRSTGTDADQPDVESDTSPAAPLDQVPELADLVALTPKLINMRRSVHVSHVIKAFQQFCLQGYFQPAGPLMISVRSQLKASQGAGSLPLQSLSKGEKWTVSTIEDKELKKSLLRSWETFWSSHSSPADLRKMVTRDMQKQVRAVVHGQTELLRSICFLEELGSHFPNTAFPSPAHLLRSLERQPEGEQANHPPAVVTSHLPMQLDDLHPAEQAAEAVNIPSNFHPHAQSLFSYISPSFTLRDIMEDVEQDDTRELKVREGQAQSVVIRLLSGACRFVAEKAHPHAVSLLEDLLNDIKAQSERWTEKDAWEWVESMDVEGEGLAEERRSQTRAGPGTEEKTRLAQTLWRESWEKINGAREQGLVRIDQAEAHEKLLQYREAIVDWTAALEADPKSTAFILYRRGQCYRSSEQPVEAEKDWGALVEIKDPSAAHYQMLVRPGLKRLRQKLKAGVTAPAAAGADSTSPDLSGSKSKKSKKKKKGSVDASAAVADAAAERDGARGVEEQPSRSPAVPTSPTLEANEGAPVAFRTVAFEPEPTSTVTQNGNSQEKEPLPSPPATVAPSAQLTATGAQAPTLTPSAPLAPSIAPQAPSPAPAATLEARALPVSIAPNGTFSSASSTISSSSSSVPLVASSSTSAAAEAATNSPHPMSRPDKREISMDRGPSPLVPLQQPVDSLNMAPPGRMMVDRQQQWREPAGFYPPFPPHHNGYPMYHPHQPLPAHQHLNGFPIFRPDPPPAPQELSFASLASPGGPYYHPPPPPPPQHFHQGMGPPQPYYHGPPPPPPQQQPVYRDNFSPRMGPPRPVQIQKPPSAVMPSTKPEVKALAPAPVSIVRPPTPPAPVAAPSPESAPSIAPAPKLVESPPPPAESTPAPPAAAPAPREKQPPVPMEFEDGIILFVCAEFAASGACDDSDCPHLHELGIPVEFQDPADAFTYPVEDGSFPSLAPADSSAAALTASPSDALAEPAVKAETGDLATEEAVMEEAKVTAQKETLPAVTVTPATSAPSTPSVVQPPAPAAPAAPSPASVAVNGSSTPATTPSSPVLQRMATPPQSPAPAAAAAAQKAKKPADRWWEKGANATPSAVKEDDWATAGKKAKKPFK